MSGEWTEVRLAKSVRKLRSAHWFPGTEEPGAPITAVRLWKASRNKDARAPIA